MSDSTVLYLLLGINVGLGTVLIGYLIAAFWVTRGDMPRRERERIRLLRKLEKKRKR